MSGYDSRLFLEAPPDFTICSICYDVINSPKQCPQGHVYCSICIHRHLQLHQTCPMCSCSLTSASLSNNLVVKNLIGKLVMECPSSESATASQREIIAACATASTGTDTDTDTGTGTGFGTGADAHIADGSGALGDEDGCDWTGPVEELATHVSSDCGYATIICPHEGCPSVVQRRLLGVHTSHCGHKLIACRHCHQSLKRLGIKQHGDVCERKPRECPNKCGVVLPRQDLTDHAMECSLQPVRCPHVGCGELFERRLLHSHEAACDHRPEMCDLCGESTKKVELASHALEACPERPIRCQRTCGVIIAAKDLQQHRLHCPLEEVICPNLAAPSGELGTSTAAAAAAVTSVTASPESAWLSGESAPPSGPRVAFGCSATCPGRLLRRDVENHLSDSTVLSAVVRNFQWKFLSEQRALASFVTETTEKIKRLEQRHRLDAMILSWSLLFGDENKKILAEQLTKTKRVSPGQQPWTTLHIGHEFRKEDFKDPAKPFQVESARANLGVGVEAYFMLTRHAVEEPVGCFIHLLGFHGDVECTVTAFGLGKRTPKQTTFSQTWVDDDGWGDSTFLSRSDFYSMACATPDKKLRLLLTLHLQFRQEI